VRTLLASVFRSAALACVAAFTFFLASVASTAAVGAESSPPRASSTVVPSLKATFNSRFLIGGAIEPAQISNPADAALLRRHFNSITAENLMKPRTIGTEPGVYNFAPADEIVRFAVANAMRVRGHTLLWHKTAPDWFFAGDRTDLQAYRALVRKRLETYVTDVVTHFRRKVYAWDVVNEVASDQDGGSIYRESSPWYQALGPDYIEYAFRAARRADPYVALFINDYDTEESPKRARLLAIVRDLQRKGVPIDGVGHQLHLQYRASSKDVEAALRDVEALGLINHITELDVSVYADPGSCSAERTGCLADYGKAVPAAVMSQQAALYGQLFEIFTRHASVKSVTTWGISDAHTWLTRFPVSRSNYPLLFDVDRAPKPAFRAVIKSAADADE
jgi:endo-1,4-beta-xylanase